MCLHAICTEHNRTERNREVGFAHQMHCYGVRGVVRQYSTLSATSSADFSVPRGLWGRICMSDMLLAARVVVGRTSHHTRHQVRNWLCWEVLCGRIWISSALLIGERWCKAGLHAINNIEWEFNLAERVFEAEFVCWACCYAVRGAIRQDFISFATSNKCLTIPRGAARQDLYMKQHGKRCYKILLHLIRDLEWGFDHFDKCCEARVARKKCRYAARGAVRQNSTSSMIWREGLNVSRGTAKKNLHVRMLFCGKRHFKGGLAHWPCCYAMRDVARQWWFDKGR